MANHPDFPNGYVVSYSIDPRLNMKERCVECVIDIRITVPEYSQDIRITSALYKEGGKYFVDAAYIEDLDSRFQYRVASIVVTMLNTSHQPELQKRVMNAQKALLVRAKSEAENTLKVASELLEKLKTYGD